MARQIPFTNVRSRKLTDEENESIFKVLGDRCQTLATTTAELYVAASKDTNNWNKLTTGVVCFVRDCVKRSYFIRFYDEKDKSLIWEYDVRKNLQIPIKDSSFVIIADGNKVVFLDNDEGDSFQKVLKEKIIARRKRTKNGASKESENTGLTRKSLDKKTKRKLTKEDIGKPTDLKHVGWKFGTEEDADMQWLLHIIGIDDQVQLNQEALKVISDFVDNHGGVQAFAKEYNERKQQVPPPSSCQKFMPPPPPGTTNTSRRPPLPPGITNTSGRPPPPPGTTNTSRRPLPPPGNTNTSGRPPPPPGTTNTSGRPPPPPCNTNRSGSLPPPPIITKNSRFPPPPPRKTNKSGCPPPPPGNTNTSSCPPPPPRKIGSNPPPSISTDTEAADKVPDSQHSNQNPLHDQTEGATGGNNPIKQQIMQLLLQNPEEITEFLYGIIDKRGGIDYIKDNLVKQMSETHLAQENDQQSGAISPKVANDISDAAGVTSDNVSGRRNAGEVPGATARLSPDYELGSDMFDDDDDDDDDDDKWDDFNDKIDQD